MPRYFFDLHISDGLHRDEFGEDFVDHRAAHDHAQALLPNIIRAELPDGDWHDISCDVRDETGRVIYRGEITYRGTRL